MSACLVVVGCVSTPDFEPPTLVSGPRVLAIVAEPPSVAPGESASLTIMHAELGDLSDYEVRWSACAAFMSDIGGSQYRDEPLEQGCGERALPLGNQHGAVLPGEQTAALFDNLDTVATIVGNRLPPATIEQIEQRVGLPLLVEVAISDEREVHRAVKRVLVTRGSQHVNPPPPRFLIDDQLVVVADREDTSADPFACASESGDPVVVPARAAVNLSPRVGLRSVQGEPSESDPAVDPEEENWLEEYQVLNTRGELEGRTERAFYSWFATGGVFDEDVTKSPLRDNVWQTPAAGCHRMWLVVRDGHGGTSACHVPVLVSGTGEEERECGERR